MIVALSRDVVILKVLLAMESNLFSLDFAVLNVDLVSDKDNGDVFADADQVLVPFRHVLVSDSRAHVKHDDATVSTNAAHFKTLLNTY